MDAAEDDQDVLLQRTSPDLLADLQRSLRPFLWKTTQSGNCQIRRRVRVRETDRLVNLLEPFQELPQLLDPHLDKLVPILADAFLAFLRSPTSRQSTAPTQLLTPLSRAICKLLYTFCKIRGEKVIVRFFSTETKHLELLLSAIEQGSPSYAGAPGNIKYEWDWEERYITLLWLSQLLLAPFDLSTISSAGTSGDEQPAIAGLSWPPNTPGVTLRVIPLATRYLSSSGKERDAAKVLLVRVAMRRDMQELGILHALVQWTLSCLRPSSNVEHSAYFYIGVLSFLAGVLSSSMSTTDMQSYLPAIFERVQEISAGTNPAFKAIYTLAVARKTIIKVLRTISILALHGSGSMVAAEMVEGTIANLLESLADPATPVRLAASKALSMITLKLEPDLAAQVIQAILESLEVNVTWIRGADGTKKRRDLSRVNAFEWHGLILTLSHLLYRHSPPTTSLSQIILALFLGLSFEQRSTTGASVGTNVRDAACFGIWALARRYKTDELQGLRLNTDVVGTMVNQSEEITSVLQRLATRLVVSASLDPAGNIRRGSSAALQELIGRHPNTIAEGISVVQVVDYHAVALRSRAIQEVAVQAAQLSDHYHMGLMDDLLGWRGVQDGDPIVRRNTATAIGTLVWARKINCDVTGTGWMTLLNTIIRISRQIDNLTAREVEERHGLLLCLASILGHVKPELSLIQTDSNLMLPMGSVGIEKVVEVIMKSTTGVLSSLDNSFSQYRRTELIAEAASRLMLASYSALRKDCELRLKRQLNNGIGEHSNNDIAISAPKQATHDAIQIQKSFENLLSHPSLANGMPVFDIASAIKDINTTYDAGLHPSAPFLNVAKSLLEKFMPLNENECVDAVAEAAADLLLLVKMTERKTLISSWNAKARESGRSSANQGKTYLHTLFRILPIAGAEALEFAGSGPSGLIPDIIETLKRRWNSGHDIESRATILGCLATSTAIFTHMSEFVNIISEGLDDYTTTARGDVGSFVRIEAAKAVGTLWRNEQCLTRMNEDIMSRLFGKVLRLAAEKLDKVRAEGQDALRSILSNTEEATKFKTLSTSSPEYFNFLLDIVSKHDLKFQPDTENWRLDLMEGYVTSADTGSEDLVRASRAAIAQLCQRGKTSTDVVCSCLSSIMKSNVGNDRVLVPAMEVLSFLFDVGIMSKMSPEGCRILFQRTQKAHYKTGNVRKLEAAIKLYGGLLEVSPDRAKVLEKLTGILLHPFPRVRNLVAEELWVRCGVGKGVNWVKAGKEDLVRLRGVLEENLRAGVVVYGDGG